MNLKPRQIIGLGAIVVFGSILVLQLTTPSEKEKMDRVLASLPPVTVPQSAFELPLPDVTIPDIPPLPDLNLRLRPPRPSSPK